MPDGRLKLLDGHLRRDLDPELEVEVEILDVNEEEARVLLLSIDPLAALAQTQEQLHERLLQLAPEAPPELQAVWRAEAEASLAAAADAPVAGVEPGAAQYLVLVTCRDEQEQVELLGRLNGDGLECRALLA